MKWDKDAEKLLGTELTDFLGNHGMTVTYAEAEEDTLNLELGFYTNLDVPFKMDITCEGKEDFPRAFRAFMRDFSPDDYAEKLYDREYAISDVPLSFRELVADADAVHSFLDKTVSELESIKEKHKGRRQDGLEM